MGQRIERRIYMLHQFLWSDPYWSTLSVLVIIYGWFKLWTYQSFRLKCCCSNTRSLGRICHASLYKFFSTFFKKFAMTPNWTIHNFLPNSHHRETIFHQIPHPRGKYLPKKRIFTKKLYIWVVFRHNLPNLCPWSGEIPIPGQIYFPQSPCPGVYGAKNWTAHMYASPIFMIRSISLLIIIYGWFNTRAVGRIYSSTAMIFFCA